MKINSENMYVSELDSNELLNINGGHSIWFYVGIYEGVYLKTGSSVTSACAVYGAL